MVRARRGVDGVEDDVVIDLAAIRERIAVRCPTPQQVAERETDTEELCDEVERLRDEAESARATLLAACDEHCFTRTRPETSLPLLALAAKSLLDSSRAMCEARIAELTAELKATYAARDRAFVRSNIDMELRRKAEADLREAIRPIRESP